MNLFNFFQQKSLYLLQIFRVGVLLGVLLFLVSGCSSHNGSGEGDGYTYETTGVASFYADKFQGRKTASGESFDNGALTAAHRTLPFGTMVVVKNLSNGKTVEVRINDRGPFIRKRVVDLSKSAFSRIEDLKKGITKVQLQVMN